LVDQRSEFDVSFYLLSNGGSGTIKYMIYNMNKKVVAEDETTHVFKKGVDYHKMSIPRTNLTYSKYRLVIKVKLGADEATAERSPDSLDWNVEYD
jgi:hypothetical protein